jgi:hypothetical protein
MMRIAQGPSVFEWSRRSTYSEKGVWQPSMKNFLIYLALFGGQMNTLQDRPVVHLHPRQNFIPIEFGGDLVEFMNTPSVIQLPQLAPVQDSRGRPWLIEVRNLGPGTVTIVGGAQFNLQVPVGKTVSIKSTKAGYASVR